MSIYIFFRVFKNPNPPKDLVLSAIDTIDIAILENLASKSCLPNSGMIFFNISLTAREPKATMESILI